MNIWAVVAVCSALVLGICIGAILVYSREKRYLEMPDAVNEWFSDAEFGVIREESDPDADLYV